MARVYLDANYFIDLVEKRKSVSINQFVDYKLFLSPLSIHIYTYLYKIKLPNPKLQEIQAFINVVPIDEVITSKSISGPTPDFEDNLQLHSSVSSECDYFLTNDKYLLSLRFFGKTQIVNRVSNQ